MLFSEFGLKQGLIRSLNDVGYIEATPIQEQVMKIALSGKNIVGQSQTGTGKTAAFLLPILNKVDTNNKQLQVLILAPTRELVTQIGDEIRNLTKFYGVTYACLYGGASPNLQMQKLKRKPAIIVSTTGRLMDFMGQGLVNIGTVDYFVLDEVDMMLDMGFVRDIKKIRSQMKNIKQTYTFSATMNNDMKTIIKEHVDSYEFIKIGDVVTVDKINHKYIAVEHEHKLSNMIKLINTHSKDKVLIFTHTKRNTKTIHKILTESKINAGLLNGNMGQGKRQATLDDFKAGKLQVLVTTDVAARGLNMENVGLVINFDVPVDAKSYIHRIGRTGRAGAYGKAVMLVSLLEKPLLRDIEQMHKINIEKSDHVVIKDTHGEYIKIRLNKSTDKLGGKRLQGKSFNKFGPKRSNIPGKKFSKDFKGDKSGLGKDLGEKKEYKKRYGNTRSEESGEKDNKDFKVKFRKDNREDKSNLGERKQYKSKYNDGKGDENRDRRSKPAGRRRGRKR